MDRGVPATHGGSATRLYAQLCLRLEFGFIQYRHQPWSVVSQESELSSTKVQPGGKLNEEAFYVRSGSCSCPVLCAGSCTARWRTAGGSRAELYRSTSRCRL